MSEAKKLPEIQDVIAEQWKPKVHIVDLNSVQAKSLGGSFPIHTSDKESAQSLLEMVVDKDIHHICQTGSLSFNAELNTSALMLCEPKTFFKKPLSSIFAAETLAGSSAVDSVDEKKWLLWERSFSQSAQKSEVLGDLESILKAKNRPSFLIRDVIMVADELFTNAVFNAPFVDLRTHVNPNVDRSSPNVEMGPGKKARIFIGSDNERLVIGCSDPFGSLSVKKLMQRVLFCHNQPGPQLNLGQGGAGIGSFMVYSASTSYFVAVNPGEQTLVCSGIPERISGRRRGEIPKNIHLLLVSGGDQ